MKKLAVIFANIVSLSYVPTVLAQAFNSSPTPEKIILQPPGGAGINPGTPLNTIIGNILTIVFVIAIILVLVMLIWGAVQWILSGGDKEAVGNARKRITNALIGLAILALAFLIVRIVGDIVGINVLGDLKLPSLEAPVSTPTPTGFKR